MIRPILRDWLLTCPELTSISTIALDAGTRGLLDLPDAIAKAVAADVHLCALGASVIWRSKARHARLAKLYAWRRRHCHLVVRQGTVLLDGRVAQGAGLAQMPGAAVVHIRQQLPETLLAALPGRRLDELIDMRIATGRGYRVTSAERDGSGITIWFDVPTVPIASAMPIAF